MSNDGSDHHSFSKTARESITKSLDFIFHQIYHHTEIREFKAFIPLVLLKELTESAHHFSEAVDADNREEAIAAFGELTFALYSAARGGVPGVTVGLSDMSTAAIREFLEASQNSWAANDLQTPSEMWAKASTWLSKLDSFESKSDWIAKTAFELRYNVRIVEDPAATEVLDRIIASGDDQPKQHFVLPPIDDRLPGNSRGRAKSRGLAPGPNTVFDPIIIELHDHMDFTLKEAADGLPVIHMDFTPAETSGAAPLDDDQFTGSDTPTSDTPTFDDEITSLDDLPPIAVSDEAVHDVPLDLGAENHDLVVMDDMITPDFGHDSVSDSSDWAGS